MGKFFNDKYIGYHTFGLINDYNVLIDSNSQPQVDPEEPSVEELDPNLKIADTTSNPELITSLIQAGILNEGTTEFYYRDVMNITELPQDSSWVPANFPEFQYFTGITEIPEAYFKDNSTLKTIILPNTITIINKNAFYRCYNLQGIVIPDSVITISDYAFTQSGIQYLTLGNSVVSIGIRAFQSCNKITSSLVIPNSVTTIKESAFNYCSKIPQITIGNSVTTLETQAFMNCGALNVVYLNPTIPPTLGSGVFAGTNDCPLVVPKGLVSTYTNNETWTVYTPRLTDTYNR